MISLKISLTISLVSSSHALMSSALIPLLSGDFLFLSLLIAVRNSSVVISGHHLIDVVVMHIDDALIFILTDFSFSFFLFIVVV